MKVFFIVHQSTASATFCTSGRRFSML